MKYSFKYTGEELQRELFVDFVEFQINDIRDTHMYENDLSEEEVNKISDEELFRKYSTEYSDLDKKQYYLTDGELQNAYPVADDTPSVNDKAYELFVSKILNPESPKNPKKLTGYHWEELYEYIMNNYLKESNDIKSLYEFTYKSFNLYDKDEDIINIYKEKHTNEDVLDLFIGNRNYKSTMYIICHHLNAFPIKLSKYTTKYLLQTS